MAHSHSGSICIADSTCMVISPFSRKWARMGVSGCQLYSTVTRPISPGPPAPLDPGLRPYDDPDHPSSPLDSEDSYQLRWKAHLLDLAVGGLLKRGSLVEPRDIEAIEWAVMELVERAPWHGSYKGTFEG